MTLRTSSNGPIRLPLLVGQVIVFDLIAGVAYVGWRGPR